MSLKLSRRLVLGSGLAAMAAPALLAQQPRRLRMTWWGGPERQRRTQGALDTYMRANPGLQIEVESLGWGDYWTRLATQVAGNNAPDVIQMDYRYIYEYARRRALRPLDEFMPNPLDIADFGQANLDTGKVDNQLFGVSMGVNSVAMFYDRTVLQRLNIQPPSHTTTWAQFAELAVNITRAAGRRGYWGTMDAGFTEPTLEVWVRQRGKSLYTAEGRLGFTRDDIAEFFDYWDALRRAGGAVAGDVQALDRRTAETDVLTLGRAAITFANSNQLVAWQTANQNRLGMTMFPQGPRPGQYYKPSMLLSMSGATQATRESARLINYLSVNPEAGASLGVERGVPPSARMRAALTPTVDELGRAQIDYIALMADRVSPIPPPPPSGAGEVEALIRRSYESISVGGTRVPAAADQFYAEATRIVGR